MQQGVQATCAPWLALGLLRVQRPNPTGISSFGIAKLAHPPGPFPLGEMCHHNRSARTLSTGGMAKEKRSTRFVSPFRMESPFCSASGSVVKCRYRKYRRTSRKASLLNTCSQTAGDQRKPSDWLF